MAAIGDGAVGTIADHPGAGVVVLNGWRRSPRPRRRRVDDGLCRSAWRPRHLWDARVDAPFNVLSTAFGAGGVSRFLAAAHAEATAGVMAGSLASLRSSEAVADPGLLLICLAGAKPHVRGRPESNGPPNHDRECPPLIVPPIKSRFPGRSCTHRPVAPKLLRFCHGSRGRRTSWSDDRLRGLPTHRSSLHRIAGNRRGK